jgi:hypothetical protein
LDYFGLLDLAALPLPEKTMDDEDEHTFALFSLDESAAGYSHSDTDGHTEEAEKIAETSEVNTHTQLDLLASLPMHAGTTPPQLQEDPADTFVLPEIPDFPALRVVEETLKLHPPT